VKYYDTSALLRAWKEGWAPERGLTRSHTVAEWISIQTRRGLVYRTPQGQLVKRNLSSADAAREAQQLFAQLTFCDLTGAQTLEAARLAATKREVRGGNFHDFLHARTAEIFGAECIVTLNLRDYGMMTDLPLELPLESIDPQE
jgi:predicted nucleic acid-binding protein